MFAPRPQEIPLRGPGHAALCNDLPKWRIRQFAKFFLYTKIALRNYVLMPNTTRHAAIAQRPWLTREPGECAFPIDGDGLAVRSCCNPCDGGAYCAPHRALMRGPPAPSVADLERELSRFLG